MKLLYGIAFVSAVATLVNGLSFSEIANESAPSPRDADLASEEESRIYGGSNADINKYPYLAALFVEGTDGRKSRKAEQIRAVEGFRHPLHNSTLLTYDVALLKLEKPSTHKPARLCDADGSDNKPGTMATVLGWGEVKKEVVAETLQSVDAKIIPDDECGKYAIDTDVTLCAGTERGKGFCGGDLGGPLIANDVVVGIASALPGDTGDCGDLPSLYTRVSHVLDFVTDVVNGGSTGNVTELLPMPYFVMEKSQ
ncbi:hypothetical protein Pcac1_g19023 [Phytophthora cactorum]|uniref:Peptidase S1 domain-containing protein n=1 Tax=Phytophthora cactorum TaxID=29920 RepID=A0A8T1AE05_9STRA|nr:hypothetical protein Pcac1_g19023 [Phytophthora cactorum]KAG2872990.1 hypothetical protein PC114_g26080 [Phytophthora cactorum]KAG2877981.1 hypothetical protein PC115_g23206 [Phytophthora cactorum]KAG2956613.1 hypothetical protein PC119_g27618 [Phytophthora cactorum]